MIATAIALTISIVIASNLGLTEAIGKIVYKILKCTKCCTFWCTSGILILLNYNIICSIVVALLMSYLSYWIELLFIVLIKLYNELWEKLNNNQKKNFL